MAYVMSGRDTLASAPVQAGAFTLTVPVDQHELVYLVEGDKSRSAIVCEKGKITYEMSEGFATVSGAKLNDSYMKYRAAQKDLTDQYMSAYEAEDQELIDSLHEQAEQIEKTFYEDNASNYLGLYMLASSVFAVITTPLCNNILEVVEKKEEEKRKRKEKLTYSRK